MRRSREPVVSTNPPKKKTPPRGCMAAFFGIFGIAGLSILSFTVIHPVWMAVHSRNWVPTDCEVLSSDVERHAGSDGDTFRIAISYRYRFQGREYTSDRYTFSKMSSSGERGKEAVVDQYPVESHHDCLVNPEHPEEAVLNRGPTSDAWWGLFALPFIGVGSLAFFYGRTPNPALRGRQAQARLDADDGESLRIPDAEGALVSNGSRELKPTTARSTQFWIMVGVTLFWNGIVSVFLYHVVEGFQLGRPEWGITLFLMPFVAVGLLLLGGTLYQGLALANPTVRVTTEKDEVRLGEELSFAWELVGRAERILSFKVILEGREAATYTRGTTTSTDRNVFLSETVAEFTDPASFRNGTARVRIPAGTMHSFSAGHNAISWHLRFHGEIPRFPDIRDEFTLTVLPLHREPPTAS